MVKLRCSSPVGKQNFPSRRRLHHGPVLTRQCPQQTVGSEVPHSLVDENLIAVGVEQTEAGATTKLVELMDAHLSREARRRQTSTTEPIIINKSCANLPLPIVATRVPGFHGTIGIHKSEHACRATCDRIHHEHEP